jgi:hypothetical protein
MKCIQQNTASAAAQVLLSLGIANVRILLQATSFERICSLNGNAFWEKSESYFSHHRTLSFNSKDFVPFPSI